MHTDNSKNFEICWKRYLRYLLYSLYFFSVVYLKAKNFWLRILMKKLNQSWILCLEELWSIKIGDKEIENPHYKPELQAQTTLINFTVTRQGLKYLLFPLLPHITNTTLVLFLAFSNQFLIQEKSMWGIISLPKNIFFFTKEKVNLIFSLLGRFMFL